MLIEESFVYSPSLGILAIYNNDEQLTKIIDNLSKKEDPSHKLPIYCSPEEQNFSKKFSTSGGINLTSSCQLRCNYCTFNSGDQHVTLDQENAYAFINFLIKNILIRRKLLNSNERLTVYFSGGGEPTYHWALLKNVVSYIKDQTKKYDIDYKLHITTNGILNDHQTNYLMDNFVSILVSFDGLPYIQNENRKLANKYPSFDIVRNTLQILNNKEFNFNIRTTIWPYDYCKIEDMATYIFDTFSNIKTWEIFPVYQQGRAQNSDVFKSNTAQSITNFDLCDVYLSLSSSLSKKDFDRISIPLFKKREILFECGTAFGNYPWLDSDAKIITCLDSKENATTLGTISNGIVKCNKFKDTLSLEHIKSCHETCFNCIAYRYCGGGCPLRNPIFKIGSQTQQDWTCQSKKKYWNSVFNNIIRGNNFNGWELRLKNTENDINYYFIARSTQ